MDVETPLRGEVLLSARSPRWPAALLVLLCSVFETGLLLALGRAVVTGDWSFDGGSSSVLGAVVGWVLAGVFTVLLGVFIRVALRSLASGAMLDRITTSAAVRTVGTREVARIDLETARRITYLPGLRATWQVSGKPADRRRRWSSSGLGRDRLVLEGVDRLEFTSGGAHWPGTVNALARWADARPDLCADEETTRLLGVPYPDEPSRARRWAGPLICMTLTSGALTWLVAWAGGVDPGTWLSVVASGLFFGGLLWVVLVRPYLTLAQGLARVWRERDPWAFFAPDEHGRYNWLLQGRSGTVLRAPTRRTRLGLSVRYGYLLLVLGIPVLLVVEVVLLVGEL